MFSVNQQNVDLPITALCIVSDKTRCPPNYTPVIRSHDTGTEPDLWKDSLFGKKINRFFCFTKDYPINDTYNVIEDIKLLNERETLPGFIPLEKCLDTSEKTFQKKTINIKVSHRFYTTTAVSDIVLLVKSKRPPVGYSYIGEINSHAVCIKFSQIPNTGSNAPMSNLSRPAQSTPPPIPPRPHSSSNPTNDTFVNDFVSVPRLPPAPSSWTNGAPSYPVANMSNNFDELNFYQNKHSQNSLQHSHANFNPLQGVPFEINPVYSSSLKSGIQDHLIDAEKIERKISSFKETFAKTNYDFTLEKTLMQSSL